MSELLRLLASSLAFLLEPGRFTIVSSSSGRSFGDARVTLQSETMRLELIRDRSQNAIRFQPVIGSAEEWFWLGVLRRSLDGDRPGSDELDGAAIGFLRRSLDTLENRLIDSTAREVLIAELTQERSDRSVERFGL